jgi:hypothetical protein
MAVVLWASGASARSEDGALTLISTPNGGKPALVTPGDTFEAMVSARGELHLVREGAATALETAWQALPGEGYHARCTVPTEIVPGTYALALSADAGSDQNVRAVYVFESFPESYAVAHVTDVYVGSTRHFRTGAAIFTDLVEALNASEASMVLITGNLTEDGTDEQYAALLRILDGCRLPTFVAAGERDGARYGAYFGPSTFAVQFGRDGYMTVGVNRLGPSTAWGTRAADSYRLRRAIKPMRWSIGFMHWVDPKLDLRTQFNLFVDDPLDVLLQGREHRSNREDERKVAPWGTTNLIVTPAAIDGAVRFIDVGATIALRKPEGSYVAEVE